MMGTMIAMLFLLFASSAFGESLAEFADLSGCWKGEQSNSASEEEWMEPAGDMMLGMSRTVKDGKVVNYEFLMIQKREDGTFYISRPSGQTTAEFKLTSFENQQATFENPMHDFPQRIVYHFKSANHLSAWIEGKLKGEPRKIEFPMVRAKCPGGK